jgi:alpha-tubulin suppressor-like RCC1 family protein
LALRSDGSLVGWGLNNGIAELGSADIFYGQAIVPSGNNFKAIAGGTFHSLALRTDGTVVGWGANEFLGNGDFIGQATVPADIFYGQAVSRVGTNFIAIVAGDFFSLAIQVQPPALTIEQMGNNIVLSWSTNHSGYTLEAKTGLSSSLDWSEVPVTPTIIGDRHTVTNRVSSVNQFYRLKR